MQPNTYEYEESLPKLPVPSLSQTVGQLLGGIKPLVSPEEYAELENDAAQFLANKHVSLIQKHLQRVYETDPSVTCYLNSINDETNPGIYGELRGEILPRNPYLILEEDPYSKTLNPPNQAQRASSLINSSLKFIISLRNKTLKPDFTPKNNTPLTMNCYKNLFGTTRVPSGSQVTIRKVSGSPHILIICNNQFYKLDVVNGDQIWFNDSELATILQSIIDESKQVSNVDSINNSIGSITTQSFQAWKQGRIELEKSNASILEVIDTALFVVVLDYLNSPETDQEKTEVISHGTSELLEGTNNQVGSCTSRWYDKLQFIVTDNSVAGVVWESTSMDSTAILRFISDIYTDSILKLAKNINGAEHTLFDTNISFVLGSDQLIKPKKVKLVFNKTPELQNLIHLSETRLADIINQHEYKTLNLKADMSLVRRYGIAPDSFLQICFQIANYTLYGHMANTLEPITTRKFRDSRTELITVQNTQITNLVKRFITTSNLENLWDMFVECCQNHTKQYQDAMLGGGFERHTTSLIQILLRQRVIDYLNDINEKAGSPLEPIPSLDEIGGIPLLSSPLIDRITKPELLISNCGNPALHLFGIPPAIDQGFGIGYIIHKDKVQITISSKHRQTDRFLDTFSKVVNDIKHIVKSKTNFLINLADSESRKHELQKLRIEKELSNVDKEHPLTRHPINITIDTTPIPLENISPPSETETKKSDYDLLGGYGYFDFGQLDLRMDELSRSESFLNSSSNLTSRQHSGVNLRMLAHETDLRQKMSLSESIRDKLLSEISLGRITTESPPPKKKNQIGRELSVDDL